MIDILFRSYGGNSIGTVARSTISKIEQFVAFDALLLILYTKKTTFYNKQIHNQSDEQQEKTGK
jgi:hypothetical protein